MREVVEVPTAMEQVLQEDPESEETEPAPARAPMERPTLAPVVVDLWQHEAAMVDLVL
jgi:hypothetical protein